MIDAARADFIDKDVIEVIEDFMIHAPLKNIKVELRKSVYKEQGFSERKEPLFKEIKTLEHEIV
jgi:hypothetical protein